MSETQEIREAAAAGKQTRLYLHLKKWLEKAVMDFGMIEEGDRVLVGVSGGKDSHVLLDLLDSPMVFVPRFTLMAVNIDPGFDPDYETYGKLEAYLQKSGCRYVMEKSDIGPLAHSSYNRKNPCFLCSRLRRKRIFELAGEHGFNKIAFAHHRDDIIETLLINMFFGREISTMMPNQVVFGGKMSIIRPMAYIREDLVKRYAAERAFPVTESRCPTGKSSRRSYIKNLLNTMERDNRKVRDNLFRAMGHVKPDYLPKLIQDKK